MSRPIPAGDYVEHFDPELPHQRAWLLAVLEQLVAHEPQALEEGGTLRWLWTAHQAGVATTPAPSLPVPPRSNPPSRVNPLPVPWFAQLDSASDEGRRMCFSSSCAMLVEALRPGSLKGTNGDDQTLSVVQSYGDSTDANAQLQALAHFGVTARLIEQQINRGIPVPCGYLHRGPVNRPTGSGHWLVVVGHTPTHVVVNDPCGEPDLIHGTTLNANGMGLWFSRLNYRYAGLRLRQALDGGAHRWRCLPLCPGQGLGGGGGCHPLTRFCSRPSPRDRDSFFWAAHARLGSGAASRRMGTTGAMEPDAIATAASRPHLFMG